MEHQPSPAADQQAMWKLAAARAAVSEVPDGATVGLGTGSTAELMLAALADRMRQGLRVTGVATSERTASVAAALGIPLTALDDVAALDLSMDGADEVLLPWLDLIKGRGGALFREKLVAATSRYRIIIVDATKLVSTLATQHPIPVEVAPFGWTHTARRLEAIGARPVRRPLTASLPMTPFVTDGGNFIVDCWFGPLSDPADLAARIKGITGVIDHGLFVGMTERVYVAGADGVRTYDRPR